MHRGKVDLLLLLMTATTNFAGWFFTILGARSTADGADIVCIVAIVTSRVGIRLIHQVRSGMHRIHVAVNLRNHHIQALVLGVIAPLLLLPSLQMTLDAADALRQRLFVLGLLDAVVAAHAGLLPMHAVRKALGIDIDVDDGAVITLRGHVVLVIMAFETAPVRNDFHWFFSASTLCCVQARAI